MDTGCPRGQTSKTSSRQAPCDLLAVTRWFTPQRGHRPSSMPPHRAPSVVLVSLPSSQVVQGPLLSLRSALLSLPFADIHRIPLCAPHTFAHRNDGHESWPGGLRTAPSDHLCRRGPARTPVVCDWPSTPLSLALSTDCAACLAPCSRGPVRTQDGGSPLPRRTMRDWAPFMAVLEEDIRQGPAGGGRFPLSSRGVALNYIFGAPNPIGKFHRGKVRRRGTSGVRTFVRTFPPSRT